VGGAFIVACKGTVGTKVNPASGSDAAVVAGNAVCCAASVDGKADSCEGGVDAEPQPDVRMTTNRRRGRGFATIMIRLSEKLFRLPLSRNQ